MPLTWNDILPNQMFNPNISIPRIETNYELFKKAAESVKDGNTSVSTPAPVVRNQSSISSSSIVPMVGLADPTINQPVVAPTASNGLSMTSNKGQPINVPEKAVQPFLELFKSASKQYNVPVPVLLAVAQAESNFNPNAKSATGVRGLMQVTKGTYKDLGFTGDRSNPTNSINAGAKLLANLFSKYGNWDDAFYAYNGGHHGVTGIRNNNWGAWADNLAKQKEIRGYAPKINQYLEQWNNWYTE